MDKLLHQLLWERKVCVCRGHVRAASPQSRVKKQEKTSRQDKTCKTIGKQTVHNGICLPEESSGLVNILLSPLPCYECLQQVPHAIEHKPCVLCIFVKTVPELCILAVTYCYEAS